MSEDYSMQTISRAIRVLKSFSNDEKELSLAELHHKLDLSKSSLQRILSTLVSHGFLEKDNKRKTYKLGMELYYLGNLVEEHSHLISTAKPYLRKLRDRLGENVYLNVIENNQRKCIALEQAEQVLLAISHIGHTSPLHAGASAKLLLAYLDQNQIEDYLRENELEAVTDQTILDKVKLRKELQDIRYRGYSISYSERVPGVCSVSAPIFNARNEVVAGVSVSAPLVRVNDEIINNFIVAIKEIAQCITEDLNFLKRAVK